MPTRSQVNTSVTTLLTPQGSGDTISGSEIREAVQDVLDYVDQEVAAVNTGGGGAVSSVNSQTGTVVLDADDIADGTTNKAYTATEKTKLSGIATGATANSSDASLLSQAATAAATAISTAVTGLLDFKGTTDASTNPNYPAASKGDAYIISVAGKIGGASGTSVDAKDWVVATADNAGGTQASVGTSWSVLEHNLLGAILSANNLSDLASPPTALANLGAQAALVSATNIKTVNGTSILGSGNLVVSGSSGSTITFDEAIPFNSICSAMEASLAADVNFTVDSTDAAPGNGAIIRLTPNGHNVTFDAAFRKITTSGDIVDGEVNIIIATWDGVEPSYLIYQYEAVAAPTSFVDLDWAGLTDITLLGRDYTFGNGANQGHAFTPSHKWVSGDDTIYTWGTNAFNLYAGFHTVDTEILSSSLSYAAYQGGGNPGWYCYDGPNPSSLISFPSSVTDYAIKIDGAGNVSFVYSNDNRATWTSLYDFPTNVADLSGAPTQMYPMMMGGGASYPIVISDPEISGGTAY